MAAKLLRWLMWLILLNGTVPFSVQAGGSGLNVVVVVNQNSPNSCELGNYFCEQRGVPPENLLRIQWSGGNTTWTSNNLQSVLLTPLLDLLVARQLTNQIDYVVLSMDIPFQTTFGTDINGTSTALFYGLKSDGGAGVGNSYGASEAIFQQAKPASAPGLSFLTTMITASSLDQAKLLVDQGVASDKTFPSAPVLLAKSSDVARNLRHLQFDNTIFDARILGSPSILRTNSNDPSGQTGLLGYQTGLMQYEVSPGTFVPGAIADSLTSFGGIIFGPNDQTNLLALIKAGAAGSYGTVIEPGTSTEKFPNSQVYFYQARGFTLAESYYQSVNAPYHGLMVAEPLASPFAKSGSGGWNTNLASSVLSNTSVLSMQFHAGDPGRPLHQVDLFVDGKYFSTLTNLPPGSGNQLTATLNGYPVTYTVVSNDTLASVTAGLAALVNNPVATNATKVMAIVHGDRIELQSIAPNPLSVPFYIADTTPTNTPGLSYLVTSLPNSFPPRMLLTTPDASGVFKMDLEIPGTLPYVVQATTNFVDWLPVFTNDIPGLQQFRDIASTNYSARFYRMTWPDPFRPPELSAPSVDSNGTFRLHVESVPGLPCAIETTTNFTEWSPVFTNGLGGSLDYVDGNATNSACKYYRAWLVPPASPAFSVLNGSTGVTLVRVDGAVRPYTVEISTNQGQWNTLFTNFNIGKIQTVATSAAGSGNGRSTFLGAGRPVFLESEAHGRRKYTISGSAPSTGAWIEFQFTKTNGQTVVLGVTNQPGGASMAQLASQLYNLINTHPALLGSDGVVAEDFTVVLSASFNLRARSPGFPAAAVSVLARRSSSSLGLYVAPAFVLQTLTQNLSDLQPRNHLYVTAGADQLNVNFSLDTTQLPDGYHELTAVAYEGSHVRTQTRTTMPVCISNSPLCATLTLLDLTNNAPAQAAYHIAVTANTNNVSLTTLYSTGGPIGIATNNPSATFDVIGTNLWAGLHPFYALVETATGQKYRTQTTWIRLQ